MALVREPRVLKGVVLLVSMHSLVLGMIMLLFPRSFPHIFGFPASSGIFWQSQSGIFLMVLGIVYFMAYREAERSRTLVKLLVLSKGLAVLFLLTHWLFLAAPDSIALAAVGDGVMGACVGVLHLKTPLSGESTP
jgi:hypothetical protein